MYHQLIINNQKQNIMYYLLDSIKEDKNSVFFQGENLEDGTFRTIEIEKEHIQDYLEYCGQPWIPASKIDNIRHFDCVADICQDIVKFGKIGVDFHVLKSEKSTKTPAWSLGFHNACRYSPKLFANQNPKRGEFVVDGYVVKGYSLRVFGEDKIHDHLKYRNFAPQTA